MSIRSFFTGIAARIRGTRISDRSISVVVDDKMHTVHANAANFQSLKEELEKPQDQQDADLVADLVDLPKYIVRATHGRVQVADGLVLFDGKEIHNFLTERLLAHLAKGIDIKPLALFLDNVMDNPDTSVREDLFEWCYRAKLPITEDGKIIAFKSVRSDYKSFHDGKTLHVLGEHTTMPREACDTNRNRNCSTGLHWCVFGYLSTAGYSSGRILVVVVNPRDVTSIPSDSSHAWQKGRCCDYLVAGEVTYEQARDIFTGKLIVTDVNTYRAPDSYVAEPDPVEEEPVAEEEVESEDIEVEADEEIVADVEEQPETETLEAYTYYDEATDASPTAFDIIVADDLVSEPPTAEERQAFAAAVEEFLPAPGTTALLDTEGTPAEELLPIIPDPVEQLSDENRVEMERVLGEIAAEDQPETEETVTSTELSFTRAGKTYTATEIYDLLEEHGQRGAAKITGIPRTTLQEWRKAIDKHLAG